MEHASFIKNHLKKRGSKTEYAKAIGISLSFLRQIEMGLAKTPRSKYNKVIQQTNHQVSLEELVTEKIKSKPPVKVT